MENLIRNGKFASASGWSLSHGAVIAPGGGYLLFINDAQGGMRWAGQDVPVVAGRIYALTYYAAQKGRYDSWAGYCYRRRSDGEHDEVHFESREHQLMGERFARITYYFEAPDAANGIIHLRLLAGADQADGDAFLYVDVVTLCPVGEVNPACIS